MTSWSAASLLVAEAFAIDARPRHDPVGHLVVARHALDAIGLERELGRLARHRAALGDRQALGQHAAELRSSHTAGKLMPTSLKRSASTMPVRVRNGRSSRLNGCIASSDQPASSSMVQKLLNFSADCVPCASGEPAICSGTWKLSGARGWPCTVSSGSGQSQLNFMPGATAHVAGQHQHEAVAHRVDERRALLDGADLAPVHGRRPRGAIARSQSGSAPRAGTGRGSRSISAGSQRKVIFMNGSVCRGLNGSLCAERSAVTDRAEPARGLRCARSEATPDPPGQPRITPRTPCGDRGVEESGLPTGRGDNFGRGRDYLTLPAFQAFSSVS